VKINKKKKEHIHVYRCPNNATEIYLGSLVVYTKGSENDYFLQADASLDAKQPFQTKPYPHQ